MFMIFLCLKMTFDLIVTAVSLNWGAELGKKRPMNYVNIFVVYILILMDENNQI
jgi:hypothetical protein